MFAKDPWGFLVHPVSLFQVNFNCTGVSVLAIRALSLSVTLHLVLSFSTAWNSRFSRLHYKTVSLQRQHKAQEVLSKPKVDGPIDHPDAAWLGEGENIEALLISA